MTVYAVNGIDGQGYSDDDVGVNVGPVSITGTASTNCTTTADPVSTTCVSSVGDLIFSVNDEEIITASALRAESTSTNDGAVHSESAGTTFTDLCIVQAAGSACTSITEAGTYDLVGACSGSIYVEGEDSSSSEGNATGSGLTVTMLHVDCQTSAGAIVLDIGRARTFVAGNQENLPPVAAPTGIPARLPSTGGPAENTNVGGWIWLFSEIATVVGMMVALLCLRRLPTALSSVNSWRRKR